MLTSFPKPKRRVGVYFGMIGWIKGSLLPAPKEASKTTKLGYDFFAGMVGGTLATIANTPFDVVRNISEAFRLTLTVKVSPEANQHRSGVSGCEISRLPTEG